MELWQVTSTQNTQKINPISKSNQSSLNANYKTQSDYSKILADKIANAKSDMEKMSEIQKQLDEIEDLQEELTGKSHDDKSDTNSRGATETIKRFMPDGSIMYMKIKGGEVIEQYQKKPHLVAVADPSAPQGVSGNEAVTIKMKPQLDLFSLIM